MGNWFGCRSRRRNPNAGLAAEDIIERRQNGYWYRVGRVSQMFYIPSRNLYQSTVLHNWEDSMYYANYPEEHMVQLNDIVYLPYMRGSRDDDKIGLVVRTDPIAVLIYEEPLIHNYFIDEHRYDYFLISRGALFPTVNHSTPNYFTYQTPLDEIKNRLWRHRVNNDDDVGLDHLRGHREDRRREVRAEGDGPRIVAGNPQGIKKNNINIKF